MKVSELPFEILTQIADKLSTTDRLTCALTCKGWRYPFQKALWRDVLINSYYGMRPFIRSIKAYQNSSISYPLLVRSLRIHLYCHIPEIPDINCSDLYRYLPNLKHLDLGTISYKWLYTDITEADKIWKSLESLKIQYQGTSEEQPEKRFLRLINACSMLQELRIYEHGWGYRIELGVEDFDNLHQNLRHLSAIKAGICLEINFSVPLDRIPNTIPAFTVTSIDINSKQYENKTQTGNRNWNEWNPLWLYYFGYKYPNLRSLKLEVTDISGDPMTSDQRQTIISRLQSNPNAFQHLETFDLTTNRFFESSDFVLWEFLCPLRAPLKHLALNATQNDGVDYSHPIDVNRIFQSFSQTLESLSLTGFTYSYSAQITTLELSDDYPLLTNLCISGSNVSLNLDDLLDKYVALEQLKFCGGKLFINPNTITEELKHQHQQHHGLQTLTLEKSSAAAELFDHISFRCKSLKHMTLDNFCVTGFISEKTGCLLLDMKHTFLKTLHIGQVKYGTSYEEINEDDISLTLLSQLNDASSSEERIEKEKNEMDAKYSIVEFHHIDWLYSYEYYTYPGIYGQETKKLSKEETNIALEYYKNFQSNKIGQNPKDGSSCGRENPEVGWKYELYKGYGELRFGRIETAPVLCTSND
ncbi:hypothetical protein J3Q64DRAFT_1835330 [Phycomyces blakesleeanus]|uniref:F-box domain-containing protein n=1 Tax=Phycomyces blakesleeanus TaxID=4837 RepID=A0ABR3AZU5_PHYBL